MGHGLTISGNFCVVHKYHWPTPARTVEHHIVPQEYGGPDVPENKVRVCDTGHYNIHEYIMAALKKVPFNRKITKAEKALAERGLAGIPH